MKKFLTVLFLTFPFFCFAQAPWGPRASQVKLETESFTNFLDSSHSDVQKAFDYLSDALGEDPGAYLTLDSLPSIAGEGLGVVGDQLVVTNSPGVFTDISASRLVLGGSRTINEVGPYYIGENTIGAELSGLVSAGGSFRVYPGSHGSKISGAVDSAGDAAILGTNYGSFARGHFLGETFINPESHGSSQAGDFSGGNVVISDDSPGSLQAGAFSGVATKSIGRNSPGSVQRGSFSASAVISSNSAGSLQMGLLTNGSALLSAKGAVQLLGGGGTYVTKPEASASLLVGPGTSTVPNSVTASGGFFGGASNFNGNVSLNQGSKLVLNDYSGSAGVYFGPSGFSASDSKVLEFWTTDNFGTQYPHNLYVSRTDHRLKFTQFGSTRSVAHLNDLDAYVQTTNLLFEGLNGSRFSLGNSSYTNISATATGAFVAASVTGTNSIGERAYGSSQQGAIIGTATIANFAQGASQHGEVFGTATIGGGAYGGSQRGWVIGTAAVDGHGSSQQGVFEGFSRISYDSYGSSQEGWMYGAGSISNSAGAQQRGHFRGTVRITENSHGATQLGYLEPGSTATNSAVGAVQLIGSKTLNEVYTTTASGRGSLLIGPGTQTNAYGVLANGPIESLVGFKGSALQLTNFPSSVAVFVDPPSSNTDPGSAGQIAYDNTNFFLYNVASSKWLKVNGVLEW